MEHLPVIRSLKYSRLDNGYLHGTTSSVVKSNLQPPDLRPKPLAGEGFFTTPETVLPKPQKACQSTRFNLDDVRQNGNPGTHQESRTTGDPNGRVATRLQDFCLLIPASEGVIPKPVLCFNHMDLFYKAKNQIEYGSREGIMNNSPHNNLRPLDPVLYPFDLPPLSVPG